ncbi:MFS transporter [Sphingomicrobium sp. XHP0239]|uniref:MFS transporter n=1 Tax=Sphingomicrobium maritimum TaxID=3133972 RepID=UPI0031CC5E3E
MTRFERLLVLANIGAFLAFLPLLVLLLPRRVEAVAGGDPLVLLSWLLLIGGITAGVAHVVAGAWSDRWAARRGTRRGMIALGLVATMIAFALLAIARTPPLLVAGMIAFQSCFNLMFAPLGVLLADHVPDARKGLVAGGMNMALPIGGFGIAALGWLSDADAIWPFVLVAGAVAACVLPLLLFWPQDTAFAASTHRAEAAPRLVLLRGDFARAWAARLFVQLGAASIIGYLFLYVDALASAARGFAAPDSSAGVATLTFIANLVGLGAGVVAGHLSDRIERRRAPLVIASIVAGGALALLAWAPDWRLILAAYAVFTAALTAFLSIDSALVAQLVGDRPQRGALLGLMNLTNTLPAVIAPLAALTLSSGGVTGGDSLRWLLVFAALASILAALFIARIRSIA